MSAKRATGRRWVCPTCGDGCLAPERPRRDDVRRYCLLCSAKTGRLVERTCPALDRERAEKAERATAKRSADRAKARADRLARRSHNGVDLDAEAKRIWNTAALREHHRGAKVPTIDIRRRRSAHVSGVAWPSRVAITLGPVHTAEALMLLAHELAHSAVERSGRHGHDATWASAYAHAARERWGAEHFTGIRPHSGYAVDGYVEAGIARALGAG